MISNSSISIFFGFQFNRRVVVSFFHAKKYQDGCASQTYNLKCQDPYERSDFYLHLDKCPD